MTTFIYEEIKKLSTWVIEQFIHKDKQLGIKTVFEDIIDKNIQKERAIEILYNIYLNIRILLIDGKFTTCCSFYIHISDIYKASFGMSILEEGISDIFWGPQNYEQNLVDMDDSYTSYMEKYIIEHFCFIYPYIEAEFLYKEQILLLGLKLSTYNIYDSNLIKHMIYPYMKNPFCDFIYRYWPNTTVYDFIYINDIQKFTNTYYSQFYPLCRKYNCKDNSYKNDYLLIDIINNCHNYRNISKLYKAIENMLIKIHEPQTNTIHMSIEVCQLGMHGFISKENYNKTIKYLRQILNDYNVCYVINNRYAISDR